MRYNPTLRKCVRSIPVVNIFAKFLYKLTMSIFLYIRTSRILNSIDDSTLHIFYLGVPVHPNLGDLAQGVCIRKWLYKHFPDRRVIEIETNALVNTYFPLLDKIKKKFKKNDFIVFQSGYTTTDLGGYADEMHRAIMKILPRANMLMMPQTIYFKSSKNRQKTSREYNSTKNMLFLARDRVSYNMALEMFPNIQVKLFPDIVTTLIGKYRFDYERNGILFCCRDDAEQFYSKKDLNGLITECSMLTHTHKTDTTKYKNAKNVIEAPDQYVMSEIDYYAHFKVIVTDRFHGTIFALASNTPVVVLKTTDHKVTIGAEWFQDIYNGYIYVADTLEDAYLLVKKILLSNYNYCLSPYFERQYYDKLPELISNY